MLHHFTDTEYGSVADRTRFAFHALHELKGFMKKDAGTLQAESRIFSDGKFLL